jgi:hypothetical protein
METPIESLGLSFFRSVPDEAVNVPSFLSSLQSLETCFYMIALGRYPAALIACASAWESLLRAYYRIPAEDEVKLRDLLARFRGEKRRTYFSKITEQQVREFREARNRMIHAGFSPKDDGYSVQLLLGIGFPYLFDLHRAGFGVYFDWHHVQPGAKDFLELVDNPKSSRCALLPEISSSLIDAISTWASFREDPALAQSSMHLLPFRQRVIEGLSRSLRSRTESASIHAMYDGAFDDAYSAVSNAKESLLSLFGDAWDFECPFCEGDSDPFIAEFDDNSMDQGQLRFSRGACASCGQFVPPSAAPLINYWLRAQLIKKADEIWAFWQQ